MYFMFLIVLSQLAFLHLGVRDEHLPEVLEEAWPAEHTVGHGGAGHLRDAAHTQELVLRVASQTAHQLTWFQKRAQLTKHIHLIAYML